MNHQEAVYDVVAKLLRPLVDQDLSLVFYDLTTIRAGGLSEQEGDVRQGTLGTAIRCQSK